MIAGEGIKANIDITRLMIKIPSMKPTNIPKILFSLSNNPIFSVSLLKTLRKMKIKILNSIKHDFTVIENEAEHKSFTRNLYINKQTGEVLDEEPAAVQTLKAIFGDILEVRL